MEMGKLEFKQRAMIEICVAVISNEKTLAKMIMEANDGNQRPQDIVAIFSERYADALIKRFEKPGGE